MMIIRRIIIQLCLTDAQMAGCHPYLADVESPSLRLLHGESIFFTQMVSRWTEILNINFNVKW